MIDEINARTVLSLITTHQPMSIEKFGITGGSLRDRLNVVLDSLQLDGKIVRRTTPLGACYHLVDWKPAPQQVAAPVAAPSVYRVTGGGEKLAELQRPIAATKVAVKPVKPVIAPVPPKTSHHYRKERDSFGLIVGSFTKKVHDALLLLDEPVSTRQLAEGAGVSFLTTKDSIKYLKKVGLAKIYGQGPSSRWLSASKTPTPTAALPSADQATVSNNGASEGVPQAVARSSSAGPTSVTSHLPLKLETYGDLEHKIGFHHQAALAEAELRTGAAPIEPDDEAIAPSTAIAVNLEEGDFALWSSGRLEIRSTDLNLVLSQDLTRSLIHYLDRTLLPDEKPSA